MTQSSINSFVLRKCGLCAYMCIKFLTYLIFWVFKKPSAIGLVVNLVPRFFWLMPNPGDTGYSSNIFNWYCYCLKKHQTWQPLFTL